MPATGAGTAVAATPAAGDGTPVAGTPVAGAGTAVGTPVASSHRGDASPRGDAPKAAAGGTPAGPTAGTSSGGPSAAAGPSCGRPSAAAGTSSGVAGTPPHIPVLLAEVLAYLRPERGGRFVDGTVGAGGHAAAILEAAGEAGRLLGIDRDPQALALAAARLAPFGDRVRLVHGNFRDLGRHLAAVGWDAVDGILLDLGVSSMQLDDPARGFSYQVAAPLDMRMDPSQPVTAADLVNTASRDQLARWIAEYGEERWAGRIADFIVAARQRRPITTTLQLVEVIKDAIPARARRRGGHPARRTFQALRIAVNGELEGLEAFLQEAAGYLRPGGRLVVISFHSLEDRAVKRAFRALAAAEAGGGEGPSFRILTRRPVTPGAEEEGRNPRARSAKLRALERSAGSPDRPGPSHDIDESGGE